MLEKAVRTCVATKKFYRNFCMIQLILTCTYIFHDFLNISKIENEKEKRQKVQWEKEKKERDSDLESEI